MRQRKAFTLVEMMIVVGLIVVLIGLAVTAYTKLVNSSAERGTTTALQNAQSLLAEYEQAVGLGPLGFNDPNFPYHGGFFTQDDNPLTSTKNLPIGLGTTCVTGLVAEAGDNPNAPPPLRLPGRPDDNGNITYALDLTDQRATFNTAAVMMYIARLPQARPMLSSLPTKGFLKLNVKDPNGDGTTGIAVGVKLSGSEAPMMLDGWGNPIIYVPPGGLSVQLKATTRVDGSPPTVHMGRAIVRTSGLIAVPEYTYPQGQIPSPPPPPSVPLKANDRPFWASAGPDGNFDTGDDNIYSFHQ